MYVSPCMNSPVLLGRTPAERHSGASRYELLEQWCRARSPVRAPGCRGASTSISGCLGGAAGPRAGNMLSFRRFCEMVFQSVNVPVVLYLYQPLESPVYWFQSSYWLERYLRLHFSDD